jgi:hypothetical protein
VGRAVIAGVAVVVAVAAVPLLLRVADDSGTGGSKTTNDALSAVRAAVGQTIASGSYQSQFESSSVQPQQCTVGAGCPGSAGPYDSYGTATVSFNPYVSHTVTTTSSSGGGRTLYVTATTVWLGSADSTPPADSGIALSSFAPQVENTLGPSQGALSMISLASPGGSINLEEDAVASATPDGDGTVDGDHVTYYDVTIDMTQLANTPDLSGEQEQTIAAALPLLREGGYTGTTEQIGVDDAGFIREVTAENHFSDSSKGIFHGVLYNFGCAPKQYAPDQVVPPVTTTLPCQPAWAPPSTAGAPPTSTTAAPSTTTTTTTSASGPTTTAPATMIPPTTAPATTSTTTS